MKNVFLFALLTVLYMLAFKIASPFFPEAQRALTAEGQIVENLTAVFFLAAFLTAVVALCRTRHPPLIVLSVFIALTGLIGFLDEISFGYSFLYSSAPHVMGVRIDAVHDVIELFSVYARQRLDMPRQFVAAILVVAALGVLLLLVLLLRRKQHDGRRTNHAVYVLLLLFAGLLLVTLIIDAHLVRSLFWLNKHEESIELFAALALLLGAVTISQSVSPEQPSARWRRMMRASVLTLSWGIPLVAGVLLTYNWVFREPYRLQHYWGVRLAILDIPGGTTILTTTKLKTFCKLRNSVITWAEFETEKDGIDIVLGELSHIEGYQGQILAGIIRGRRFGMRHFDGDLFVLERGRSEPVSSFFLRTLENIDTSLWIVRSLSRGGETRYVKSAGKVRYWNGNGPTFVSFGRKFLLPAGRYRATLRYRADRRESVGSVEGRFGILREGDTRHLTEVSLPVTDETDTGFTTRDVEFMLQEPSRVEPWVSGGHDRLWLHNVVIEKII